MTDQQSVSSRRVGDDSVSMLSKALSQAPTSKASETVSVDQRKSTTTSIRPKSSSTFMKKKIFERINQMNDNELLKIGKDLDVAEKTQDERVSVITQERLSKFNQDLEAVEPESPVEEPKEEPSEGV